MPFIIVGANIALATRVGSIFLRCMHFHRCAKHKKKLPNTNIYIYGNIFGGKKPAFWGCFCTDLQKSQTPAVYGSFASFVRSPPRRFHSRRSLPVAASASASLFFRPSQRACYMPSLAANPRSTRASGRLSPVGCASLLSSALAPSSRRCRYHCRYHCRHHTAIIHGSCRDHAETGAHL